MRPRRIKRIAAAICVTSAVGSGLVIAASEAKAEYDPGCVQQFWMYGLRGTTRTICDGPIMENGGWNRGRQFYAPRRYVPVTCSWSRYGGSCFGGYWQEEFDKRDFYVVMPDNVLPDEPGHIPEGATA